MTADFDDQWQHMMSPEFFQQTKGQFEFDKKRVKEFLNITGFRWNHKKIIKNKKCLDVGCGPGRWTWAMQQLKGIVSSIDISEEAVKRCRIINPDCHKKDIFELVPNPVYDFVLAWGVLHHTHNTQEAFSKVVTQVKKGGVFHIMVYNKENDWAYDGFRGDNCVENHSLWEKLTWQEKIEKCNSKVREYGGDTHGWFDAFNPKYNWSHTKEEVKGWFEEEGFEKINIRMIKQNININGVKIS